MSVYNILVYIIFGLVQLVIRSSQDTGCQNPLGMENGNITNDQFLFSDKAYYSGKEPYKARLNGPSAYCTPTLRGVETFYDYIYFTIDLRNLYTITSFDLQGFGGRGFGNYMKLFIYSKGNEHGYKYNGSDEIKLPTVVNYTYSHLLKLTPTLTNKLKIQLLVSSNHHCLRMEIYGCIAGTDGADADNNKNNNDMTLLVPVIVVIFILLLVFVLVGFIMYRYRTNVHEKWTKCRQGKHSYNNVNSGTAAPQPSENRNITIEYTNNQQYSKVENNEEEIYDTIDVHVDNSTDSGVLPDVHSAVYAECNDPALYSDPDSQIYAEPGAQYTEVDALKRESAIYSGSAIYATTYENPYKSTVSSSIYAEPDKLPEKGQIRDFPRQQLVFIEKIGVGQFGEVHICEASGLDEIYGTVGHSNSWGLPDTALVAVKLLKSIDSEVEEEFMKEVEVMATLKDENVVRLLGICYEQPKLMVVEYMENGDLNQFLRERSPASNGSRSSSQIDPNLLTADQLIHMSQQISAGMKYLHLHNFIHRDLAARNCLVGPAYQIKIADFGMSRDIYTTQYYRVEGKAILPIRWMAPECIYYGKFTMETDVWSFGVTLWEIFSFARESPYVKMTDPEVIEVACELLQNTGRSFPYLSQPPFCPDDIYELVNVCWITDPYNRPTFATLCEQLLLKCTVSEIDI